MTTKQLRKAWKKTAESNRDPMRRWARKAAEGGGELALAAQQWLARKQNRKA